MLVKYVWKTTYNSVLKVNKGCIYFSMSPTNQNDIEISRNHNPPSLSFLFFVQIGVVPVWNSFVSQYDLYHHRETRKGEGLVVGI